MRTLAIERERDREISISPIYIYIKKPLLLSLTYTYDRVRKSNGRAKRKGDRIRASTEWSPMRIHRKRKHKRRFCSLQFSHFRLVANKIFHQLLRVLERKDYYMYRCECIYFMHMCVFHVFVSMIMFVQGKLYANERASERENVIKARTKFCSILYIRNAYGIY